MAYCPTPILIVSSSTNRGEVFKTYEALAAGALDVLEKPRTTKSNDWAADFLSALRMISRVRVITHPRGRFRTVDYKLAESKSVESNPLGPAAPISQKAFVPSQRIANNGRKVELIAIGTSTGGPAALEQILEALPVNFPVPILIVIHIAEAFAFAMAEWLNTHSRIPVRYARDGEPIPFGSPAVLLAPATHHLMVQDNYLRYSSAQPRYSCRPSVDVLFESLANCYGDRAVLCLLTGMGKDGAEGLLRARQAGALTIAQDESTSIVFGMPGEAVRIGAAERVLPLEQIAPALMWAVQERKLEDRRHE
jgi:two-component system chemotaxis response regulator CheB